MEKQIEPTAFANQVHTNQHEIDFLPEPGDIVVRRVLGHEELKQDHRSNCIIATYGFVELYKDNYYGYRDRCADRAKITAYHRLYFRNGDHIIRRGRFLPRNNYEFRDEDVKVWVYWPGYHVHGPFVRLISGCLNIHGVLYFETEPGRLRCRALTYRFPEKQVEWEPGDLVLRYFEPGPPGKPNPGWYRLLGVTQVDEYSRMSRLKRGDLLIKYKGKPVLPSSAGSNPVPSTRLEIFCYVLTTDEVGDEEEKGIGRLGGERWMYIAGDSMLFDFHDRDSVLKISNVDGVPQPGDIVVSLNEQLTTYDPHTGLGGFVKFYQNPSTSIDSVNPNPVVFNPTRVPEDGSTTSEAPPPNLPKPEAQAAWVQHLPPNLTVPLLEAAHPIVFRFGRWAEATTSLVNHLWLWHPHVEIYQRQPRSVNGNVFLHVDRAEVAYVEGKPREQFPVWEEFADKDMVMHQWFPEDEFEILLGDCILRRNLQHNVHPILTHSLLPCSNAEGVVRACPGDLLLRYGIVKEDHIHHRETGLQGTGYGFGAELYVLVLDEDLQGQWQFRGRDQVLFGKFKTKDQEKKPKAEPPKLVGTHDGAPYHYFAPGSMTIRTPLLAVEGGSEGVKDMEAVLKIQEGERRKHEEEIEKWKKKTENPEGKPAGGDKQGEGEGEKAKEKPRVEVRPKAELKVVEAIRPKLKHEVLIPTFLSHETGNYTHEFKGTV